MNHGWSDDAMDSRDSSPQQRAAVAVLYVAKHGPVSTRDIARITGLSIKGAYAMLCRLSASHEIELYQTTQNNWALLKQ